LLDNQTLAYLKSMKLLCVEDDEIVRNSYKDIFEDFFDDIIFAIDGADGYEKYLSEDVDIIITDYYMPTLNGLEMVEKIRVNDKNIPIILISAMDNKEIIINALRLQVHNFIKKPIEQKMILEALENSSKLLLANKVIQEKENAKLQELQNKEKYNSYQEDLAFAKELNILRNDFYYQMLDDKNTSLVDFLYQPLDVISGDAYTARRIDENRTFYLIVDGMGKGLSASLSAMIMTSFVNHIIDKMIEFDSFSLEILVKESMDYIKPILLEEEALALDYIVFDNSYNKLQYAKFAMPAILLQDKKQDIIRLTSNNPPISKYLNKYKVSEYDITGLEKFLFYSDGMIENMTIYENQTYAEFIEEDFKSSFTRGDLKTKFFEKIDEAEDDITLIFINRLNLKDTLVDKKTFNTSLRDVDLASEWYSNLLESITDDTNIIDNASVVFTELFMNAYEHGNLGLDSVTKNRLLNHDTYFDILKKLEIDCPKKIDVKVDKLVYESSTYIVTQIIDEGDGFDTQTLSEIFRNSQTFNGRGVFVSRKNSLGIYYNSKGNLVLYLNKI
jgi:CheY-like chemotaxis protein